MILRAAESSCSWYLTVDVPKWNGRHFVVKIITIYSKVQQHEMRTVAAMAVVQCITLRINCHIT